MNGERRTPERRRGHSDRVVNERGQFYQVVVWKHPPDAVHNSRRYVVELRSTKRAPAGDGSRALLTRREWEIVFLLLARATNREVAEELGISPHTARHHTQNVLTKLGLKSRSQVRAWFLSGLNAVRTADPTIEAP